MKYSKRSIEEIVKSYGKTFISVRVRGRHLHLPTAESFVRKSLADFRPVHLISFYSCNPRNAGIRAG